MKALQTSPHTSRRLAAYHEAGHAVASFYCPLAGATTRVSVRDSDLARGDAGVHYSEWRPLVPSATEPDLQTARALAVVALAGSEVDRHLTGNAFTSGSGDYQAVRELLFRAVLDPEIAALVASVQPEEAEARGLEAIADQATAEIEDHLKRLVDELRDEAHELVEAKWHHVEAVAEALLERGALDGGEVHQIIESVDRRERGAEREA